MLVDLAKHIANGYAESSGMDHQDALERIKALFDAEWRHATDAPTGGIVGSPFDQDPEG
jgi:hypothetical protein